MSLEVGQMVTPLVQFDGGPSQFLTLGAIYQIWKVEDGGEIITIADDHATQKRGMCVFREADRPYVNSEGKRYV